MTNNKKSPKKQHLDPSRYVVPQSGTKNQGGPTYDIPVSDDLHVPSMTDFFKEKSSFKSRPLNVEKLIAYLVFAAFLVFFL